MSEVETTVKRRKAGRPEQPIARSELIAVARRLFALRGFDGVSMAEVAAASGLQKSSLFHHFPTKDQLYKEVLDSVVAEVGVILTRAFQTEGSFEARLDAAGAALIDALANPIRARVLLREFLDPAPRADIASLQAVLDMGVAFVDAGVSAGVFVPQASGHTIMSLAGLHMVYFAMPLVSGTLVHVEDVYAPDNVARRREEVRLAVRRLMGVKG